jgi:5-methylcytosine-specific restriction endonuclease McrA
MIQYKYGKEMVRMQTYICVQCGGKYTGHKRKYCSDECKKEVRRRKNRERMRKVNPPKPDVTIMCEWCGELHTVPSRTAHQARFCSDKCRDTWWSRVAYEHKPIEERNAERRRQKIIRQKRLAKEREIAYLKRLTIKECEWCNNSFKTAIPSQVTCSDECRRKRRNHLASIRSDKRINESNLIDTDITLERLYERDNGICYLCGTECSYNDKTITSEGYFIAGETYPSIDHVKPLSKGGKHSWNNVKLAHHRCNTIKSNRITHKEKTLV